MKNQRDYRHEFNSRCELFAQIIKQSLGSFFTPFLSPTTNQTRKSSRSKNVQNPPHIISQHGEANLACSLSQTLEQQITLIKRPLTSCQTDAPQSSSFLLTSQAQASSSLSSHQPPQHAPNATRFVPAYTEYTSSKRTHRRSTQPCGKPSSSSYEHDPNS